VYYGPYDPLGFSSYFNEPCRPRIIIRGFHVPYSLAMKLSERSMSQQAEEVVQLGKSIYNNRVVPGAGAVADGQFVAIHVDTGDYVIAPSSSAALRALRATHPPDGRIFIRRIGDEPDYELSMRILARTRTPSPLVS